MFVYTLFSSLSACRPVTFGIAPISIEAVHVAALRLGLNDEGFWRLFQIVRDVDQHYRSALAKAEAKDGKRPR